MTPNQILNEIEQKYGEWIEQAGEKSPDLIIHILTVLLAKERSNTDYLKKVLDGTRNKRLVGIQER